MTQFSETHGQTYEKRDRESVKREFVSNNLVKTITTSKLGR